MQSVRAVGYITSGILLGIATQVAKGPDLGMALCFGVMVLLFSLMIDANI